MTNIQSSPPLVYPPLLDAWYLTGPTASGKTQIGIALARILDAEIVSLDSMAIYRGMDIGTAKPTKAQQQSIPHHQIDILDPTEAYSVSQYVMDAHRIVESIRSRGKRVLFVGGTPLYLKSLIRGMFLGPPADWDFRDAVASEVEEHGIESLRERLRQVDPLSAHKLLPGDQRRMTRALEVAKLTGKPLSHWQSQFEIPADPQHCKVVVLGWERADLHRRVNDRVEWMFENGFVDEVKQLLDRNRELGKTASQAVGYSEVIAHLRQELSISDLVPRVQARTRQFVRRQEIWFRSLTEAQRISMSEQTTTAEAIEKILPILDSSTHP